MYEHERHFDLLRRARRIQTDPAARGVLSTGQLLSVAIVLNKPDWLREEGYTLADAIDRVCRGSLLDGLGEIDLVLRAARDLHDPDVV